MYNPSIVKYIEGDGTGGIVICEDACHGYRYFDTEINMEADTEPMTAISRRYLARCLVRGWPQSWRTDAGYSCEAGA